jgi:hypothetical protein
MVGGFAFGYAFKTLIYILMGVVLLTPFAVLGLTVWFVFFKVGVTAGQFFAVCLLQLTAYFAFLVSYYIASDPPVAG